MVVGEVQLYMLTPLPYVVHLFWFLCTHVNINQVDGVRTSVMGKSQIKSHTQISNISRKSVVQIPNPKFVLISQIFYRQNLKSYLKSLIDMQYLCYVVI